MYLIFNTLFEFFKYPSFLERSLAVIRDECHWLSSVSWDLSIRCNLCRGKEDPKTGLCTWHDTKECVHEDCAHFMPLKSRPYFCRDAKSPGKGIIPRETYEDWLAVSCLCYDLSAFPRYLKEQ